MTENHQHWMQRALELAAQAESINEVPVGALLVRNGKVIGEGFNQPISQSDPTAHAEIMALRDAAKNENNYRLPNSTLYVTIEPCAMCAGALVHARVSEVVFGAREPRAGAICSQMHLADQPHLNHQLTWQEGVLADECSEIMRAFFKRRR
jgi:tRNA(adenine34) deaminase